MIFMRANPLQGQIPSNGPSNVFAPIKIIKSKWHVKNRYLGNFMYMSFARCHFRAQNSLDFQGLPLTMALAMGYGNGTKCIYFVWQAPPPPSDTKRIVQSNLEINSDM